MTRKIEAIDNLTDNDRYVVTVSVWKDDKVHTNCYVHHFPTRDLPIARNDISNLIHETYVRDSTVVSERDAEEAVNNQVKDLLSD
tara:strand:- start:183 stop:437 length:255 start_codon:yes stop_codon:yes gene_type:complete